MLNSNFISKNQIVVLLIVNCRLQTLYPVERTRQRNFVVPNVPN